MERGFLPDPLSGLFGVRQEGVANPYLSKWQHKWRLFRVGGHLVHIQAQVRHMERTKIDHDNGEVQVTRSDGVVYVSHTYDSEQNESERTFDLSYNFNDRGRGTGFDACLNEVFDGYWQPVLAEHNSSRRNNSLDFQTVLNELVVIERVLPH